MPGSAHVTTKQEIIITVIKIIIVIILVIKTMASIDSCLMGLLSRKKNEKNVNKPSVKKNTN